MMTVENGRLALVAVVYLSLFLDNVLLTVVGKLYKNPFSIGENRVILQILREGKTIFSADHTRLPLHAGWEFDGERG